MLCARSAGAQRRRTSASAAGRKGGIGGREAAGTNVQTRLYIHRALRRDPPGPQPPNPMKNGIHPEYKFISVRLSDGTTYQTRSTMSADRYHPEVDASNHPFYTGKKTIVDTAGRIDKFNRRYAARTQGAQKAE